MRTTPAAGIAALAALALGLAGCTASPSPDPTPTVGASSDALTHFTPAPAALQDSANCLANAPWLLHGEQPAAAVKAGMGSVPKGFIPASVVRCTSGVVVPPASAAPVQPSILEEHLAGDYGPLLAALAEPSDRQDGVNCTLQLELTPDLWLVNAAGKAIHVMWPKDVCGFSKPETAKALEGLTVASTKHVAVPATP
ncbi:hypothetical protein AL755_07635 [Arthrobacter sp. ERGS1:01]|nr:hypothetical protein AL755_07635 [Arthrobacter sp. ERGS1:01]